MPALAIWSPEDGVLGAIAPLGLAAAAGTALVIDLDPNGPNYPGAGSLAALVADGPRRSDLHPTRKGLAVLANGGIEPEDAATVLDAIVGGWPAVVLRLPANHDGHTDAIPVLPLVPGDLFHHYESGAVYQRSGWRVEPPRGAIVLPRPRRATIGMLLAGAAPPPRDRWVAAWRQLWERS
ncbi:MAG: hypothetical protein BMS9Abin07_2199 [Acidimicrobiia bacterium]|nr:MAG: hypothetical protein BMS9Abin07_2199 [Acidimicrobiia bacterium]